MRFPSRYADKPDWDLVQLAAQGREAPFAELLTRHQDAVFRFIRGMLRDADEAADLTQETFLRFYRNMGNYRPEAALRTLLFRIAKNLCIDHIRRSRPVYMETPPEPVEHDTPDLALQRAQAMRILTEAVSELPDSQRMVVLLRHSENLRYNQIAEVMDTSVSAVESLLVRARKSLRARLEAGA